MEPFDTFAVGDYICELHYDENPSSPAEWDTLGEMYPLVRSAQYLGFRDVSDTHGQAIEAMERLGTRGMVRYLALCYGVTAIPFNVYEHGGVTVHIAPLDGESCDGYIATDAARIAALGVPSDDVHAQLRGELREWADYLEGNVLGFVVRHRDGLVVDSVWGFYPDESRDGLDYIRQEARASAEWHARQDTESFRYLAL